MTGLPTLLALVWINAMCVRAEETGTVINMSEKIYREMSVESDVVGNVIRNGRLRLLGLVTDGAGEQWYLIETDLGIQGYLPAASVATGEPGRQEGQQSGSETDRSIPEGSTENSPGEKRIQVKEIVNVRGSASTASDVVGKIQKDTVLNVLSVQENELGEIWYEVAHENGRGFIRESGVVVVEDGGENTGTAIMGGGNGENAEIPEQESEANDMTYDCAGTGRRSKRYNCAGAGRRSG